MEAQVPAEGILKMGDHGDSKFYHIACSCGNDDDAITMEVEADECGVTVHFWNKVKTDWWNETWKKRYDIDNEILQDIHWHWIGFINGFWDRLKLTWKLWTRGYLEKESWTIMTEQQALNLSEVLKQSITDVKSFREERFKKHNTKDDRQSVETED